MNIWVDLANSPQVLFFRPILRELEQRGHNCTVTTRAYAQTTQLADRLNIPHTTIGQHGGRSFIQLIKQNYLRSLALARWAQPHQFDLAISHNSYSQAVAARLLAIPFVTAMDYEYQPLNHISFRLARRVVLPQPFPESQVRWFGASGKEMRYAGIKEQVYLSDFEPPAGFREREGLPLEQPLVIVRPPAPWTAYHRFENDLFDILLAFLDIQEVAYILFLPRITSQIESVRQLKNLHIAEKIYDGPALLYHADVVISGGGTMNREAAVLETPTYTVFKGKMGAVDRFLIKNGQMIQIAVKADLLNIRIEKKPSLQREFNRNVNLIKQVTDIILG